jgi:hypothetical protein
MLGREPPQPREREEPKLGRAAEPLLDGLGLDRFTVPVREGADLERPTAAPLLGELGLERPTVPLREGPELGRATVLVREGPLLRDGPSLDRDGFWRVTVLARVTPARGGVRTTEPVLTLPGTVLVTVEVLVVLGRIRSTVALLRVGVVRLTAPVRMGRIVPRSTGRVRVAVLALPRVPDRLGCECVRCPVSRTVVPRTG